MAYAQASRKLTQAKMIKGKFTHRTGKLFWGRWKEKYSGKQVFTICSNWISWTLALKGIFPLAFTKLKGKGNVA